MSTWTATTSRCERVPDFCRSEIVSGCVLHGEADLQRHLVVLDLAIDDVARGPRNFEPAQVAQGAAGAPDCQANRILDAFLRCTDQFNHPIDVFVETGLLTSLL